MLGAEPVAEQVARGDEPGRRLVAIVAGQGEPAEVHVGLRHVIMRGAERPQGEHAGEVELLAGRVQVAAEIDVNTQVLAAEKHGVRIGPGRRQGHLQGPSVERLRGAVLAIPFERLAQVRQREDEAQGRRGSPPALVQLHGRLEHVPRRR